MATTNAALYRFFAAFPGFGDTVPLGFEVLPTGNGWKNGALGAVFSVSGQRVKIRAYVNGSGVHRGMCTVTLFSQDDDTAARMRAAALFASLDAYAEASGGAYFSPETGKTYRIRASGTPMRVLITADGAAWEMKYTYEESE